jgi:hypothetical protein
MLPAHVRPKGFNSTMVSPARDFHGMPRIEFKVE